MADGDQTLFRRVYFFRVERFSDIMHGLPDALRRIGNLDFDDAGRYKLDPASGIRLSAYPDTISYPLKIRFGKIRRNGLPQVEQAGDLQTLALKEDEGLIDICHIVIFEDGCVAAEWNPDAPKLAAFASYMFEKGKLNTAPKFLSLLERDIVEVIRNLDSVRVLEIDLPPDAINLAKEADKNLAAAVEATAAVGATKRTALTLTADKPTGKLLNLALKLAEIVKSRPQESQALNSLSVRGYQSGSKTARYIDILESKLVSGDYFPRTSERSRSLRSDETYKILENLYMVNLDRIKVAASTFDMP